jgi:hypothetical protein
MGDFTSRDARKRRVVSTIGNWPVRRVAIAAFALALLTGSARADRCATQAEMSTLRVAAFQQQLMVAALTCHEMGSYNRFVRTYRPSLVSSDRTMLRLFMRLDGSDGDADYNAYKTRLANLAVLRNDANGDSYCREASADFAAAASNRRPLAAFVATRQLEVRLPYEACDGETSVASHEQAQTPPTSSPRHRRPRHLHRAARMV